MLQGILHDFSCIAVEAGRSEGDSVTQQVRFALRISLPLAGVVALLGPDDVEKLVSVESLMCLVGLPPHPVKALSHVVGDVGDGERVALLGADLDAGVLEAVEPHEQGCDLAVGEHMHPAVGKELDRALHVRLGVVGGGVRDGRADGAGPVLAEELQTGAEAARSGVGPNERHRFQRL
ncbi:hypothetical protein ABT168_38630 [Streptomyces sp. NPDC001793]|uniref:hypothetical protein n=1 Tax=Streptomyces sp. NPDC001793 TaxID=3154657 RepID=UPI00332EA725